VSHRPQHSVLEKHGERGQRGQEQPVRIEVQGSFVWRKKINIFSYM
jgi:hypothetical protein